MGIKEFFGTGGKIDNDRRVFAVDWSFSEIDAVTLPERRDDLSENPFLLKIFHINDLHCNIYTFDDDYSTMPVFSKIVNEVEKERNLSKDQPDAGVLFLSAGDDSTGSPMDHLTGYDGKDFICHPVYSAFGLAGLDATILGNHDFDTGLETLKKSIKNDTVFPVLSANLEHNGELNGLVYPGAVVVIKGVRIGIIGITTPGQIRSREGSIFSFNNPLKSVEKYYKKLSPLCDSIIILSHLGYKLGSTFAAVKIMGDMELASSLKDQNIDLIIGGHTHDFLNINGLEIKNIVNDIPILQAGFNGLFYGRTILRISNKNNLIQTAVLPTAYLQSNSHFDLAYENTDTGKNISTVKKNIGNIDIKEVYKYKNFDICKDSLENPMANFITDSLVSILNKTNYKINFSLIDGTSMMKFFNPERKNITIADIYYLMPYADTIVLLNITGKKLEEIITENIKRINVDGKHNIDRGFLHFSKEIRYKIDQANDSILDISINEIPLEDCHNKSFTIAMPNYVQGLSKSWEESEAAKGIILKGFKGITKKDTGLYVRNELIKFVKENGVSERSGFILDGRLELK